MKKPLERDICDNCQRCLRHCFGEAACRFHRVRHSPCLTCDRIVVYWIGADPSWASAEAPRTTPN